MEVKIAKPINFLYYPANIKMSGLIDLLPVGQQLIKEAVSLDIPLTGPIHWHYFDFTGENDKTFKVEVALPVATVLADYDGQFHFKRTDPFKCVSVIHEGPWHELPSTYGKVFAFIAEHKLQPTGNHREIYTNVDFKFLDANITEVQIGIA